MYHIITWIICFVSIAGVIARPFRTSEMVWAVGGACTLVIVGLLSPREAWNGISKGTDVYLFLTGMMVLAETAREEKLFDWLAVHATRLAKGSPHRLFLLIYASGTIVTIFLSNDATAVVLTPAVAAAMKTARVKKPLPYLFICAFIANAASFVLPISNPANLVIYGSHIPPLPVWLATFGVPSIVSIVVTFLLLRWLQRNDLRQNIDTNIPNNMLSAGGRLALLGIGLTAIVLLVASSLDWDLGLPTAITGSVIASLVLIGAKRNPSRVIKGVSWSILPLVAGLFVIVEGLRKTGIINALATIVQQKAAHSVAGTAWGSGLIVAFSSNLMNNLPAGLVAGSVAQAGKVPDIIKSAIVVGIDLGPNFSVTGSLATILWLVALRREGITVTAWSFLKLGIVIMTISVLLSLAALWI